MSKSWPEEDLSLNDLIGPVKKVVPYLIKWEPIKLTRDLLYQGFGLGLKHSDLSVEYLLSVDGQRELRGQGQDPLDTLFFIVFNLGIQQGRRLERKEITLSQAKMILSKVEDLKESVAQLARDVGIDE